ncbi:Na+/H+ antiporter subunit E [Quadrisphaera sp. GCM10027208]|uniref:Na+/H+ antiporter subunit E n=1 Tax=Quadrisphaera sp. GCM10027208 TaxID=3273423 RepID=UPI003615ABD3
MLRRLPTVAWITVVWVALWGDLSWGNLVGGVLTGVVVVLVAPLPAEPAGYRPAPWPALVYLLRFLRDLVVATAEVARQVFWPLDRLRPAVLEVPLTGRHPGLISLVANTISLTPGTLTLEADPGTGRLWVHLLHLEEGAEGDVVEHARALERLGARALGVDLGADHRADHGADHGEQP